MINARNMVISGAHEGKKVILSQGKAWIGMKYKENIPLDDTAVESYQIVWSERRQCRTLGFIKGIFAFLGLYLVGGILELIFVGVPPGEEKITGWFGILLGSLGMARAIWKSPWIGACRVKLLFLDGNESVIEVDGLNFKHLRANVTKQSETFVYDKKENPLEKQ